MRILSARALLTFPVSDLVFKRTASNVTGLTVQGYPGGSTIESYAGFFTVNTTTDNNLFAWLAA